MKKLICLITPGHIATNPRLVKEASALIEAGYRVHIIFTQYVDYLCLEDQKIYEANTLWTFDKLDWSSRSVISKLRRLFSGLQQKACIKISRITDSCGPRKIILNRHYFWQLKAAVGVKADLYIAHNAGALAVAADAAKQLNSIFAFDIEDFHRGEVLNSSVKEAVLAMEVLYLPHAKYLSAASPLIAAEYSRLFNRNVRTILNVFPSVHIRKERKNRNKSIKLFWFSQKIGVGRGIEEIIEAMGILRDVDLELHLLGECNEITVKKFRDKAVKSGISAESLFFYKPLAPDALFDFAVQFDLGMATETGIPYNREICLTNKIFTYIQCGLPVIASNTRAQEMLLKEFALVGRVYRKRDPQSLAEAIRPFIDHPQDLDRYREECLSVAAARLNWSRESRIYLNCIAECFS